MLTRYSNNPGPLPADLIRAQRHLSTKTNKYKGKKEERKIKQSLATRPKTNHMSRNRRMLQSLHLINNRNSIRYPTYK
jgi:hypothetical protein